MCVNPFILLQSGFQGTFFKLLQPRNEIPPYIIMQLMSETAEVQFLPVNMFMHNN